MASMGIDPPRQRNETGPVETDAIKPPMLRVPPPLPPVPPEDPAGSRHASRNWKKALIPLGGIGVLLLKFKGMLAFALKFLPVLLKTGGTMFVTIWLYALAWGWWFAGGFVLLIFVHECGHLVAARRIGLKVGAPVFIPFMGAFIALKEAPRNAWVEAQVGIGGPMLGTLGAAVCWAIGDAAGWPLLVALAHIGFLLNLFNLAPIGFLDGGRVVTALSPWLWLVGLAVVGGMLFLQFNLLLLLVLIMSLPRVFSLFRKKTDEEARYFEVTPRQRLVMCTLYFGLAIFLTWGMRMTQIAVPQAQ